MWRGDWLVNQADDEAEFPQIELNKEAKKP